MIQIRVIADFLTVLDDMLDDSYDVDLGIITGSVIVKRKKTDKRIFRIYSSLFKHGYVLYLDSKEDEKWVRKIAKDLNIEFEMKNNK